MPVVRHLLTYPLKSLDAVERDRVPFTAGGALAGDREFAIVDRDGRYVNGKRTAAVHRLRSDFDPESRTLSLRGPDEPAQTFDVDGDRAALEDWLSSHFDLDVSLRQERAGGFPDDTEASGPTVISTATLREVASWYDGIDTQGMRRRLRPNVELGAGEGEDPLPPFWEDRLFADRDSFVSFTVGDADLLGVNPCQRCVVPSRDPDTGEEYPGFRETFVDRRRATMPAWSGGDWFDHDFRVMVNTRVPESSWAETLSVGDEVQVGDVVSGGSN